MIKLKTLLFFQQSVFIASIISFLFFNIAANLISFEVFSDWLIILYIQTISTLTLIGIPKLVIQTISSNKEEGVILLTRICKIFTIIFIFLVLISSLVNHIFGNPQYIYYVIMWISLIFYTLVKAYYEGTSEFKNLALLNVALPFAIYLPPIFLFNLGINSIHYFLLINATCLLILLYPTIKVLKINIKLQLFETITFIFFNKDKNRNSYNLYSVLDNLTIFSFRSLNYHLFYGSELFGKIETIHRYSNFILTFISSFFVPYFSYFSRTDKVFNFSELKKIVFYSIILFLITTSGISIFFAFDLFTFFHLPNFLNNISIFIIFIFASIIGLSEGPLRVLMALNIKKYIMYNKTFALIFVLIFPILIENEYRTLHAYFIGYFLASLFLYYGFFKCNVKRV